MKKRLLYMISSLLFVGISIFLADIFLSTNAYDLKKGYKIKTKKARSEYFFKLLRDPASNSIPANIRYKELQFAKSLPKKENAAYKISADEFTWKEAGPNDVGGRTRALAVDRRNSNIVIAGGASGGIWKSTDGGSTWSLKSALNQQLSVSYVTQDVTNQNIWYYTSGEFRQSASNNIGDSAPLFGSGFYRSTDNGDTWNQIIAAGSGTSYDSEISFISSVKVSPTTGSVFLTVHNSGVWRSTDQGITFQKVLGGLNEHQYIEMDISTSGLIMATLSIGSNQSPSNTAGVYASNDDGLTWASVIPNNYNNPLRALVAFAPSNPLWAYVWVDFGQQTGFYFYNYQDGNIYDRTANLPDFGGDVGSINTQGSYNMVLAVKPDDPNFVIFGATNLHRSFDGFASKANNEMANWIGGYDITNDISGYPNHHADNHSLFFDPSNPNRLWSGHDGGLSYTTDIRVSNQRISWINKNNSYNVTQFYTVAISDNANDNRFGGGTQDNGSPFFTFNGNSTTSSVDASTGDGAFQAFTNNYYYTSAQEGFIFRLGYQNGIPSWSNLAFVHPSDAQNKLFIHPFEIDANNENMMFFPDGDALWRNSQLSSITNQDQSGTMEGWEVIGRLDDGTFITHQITALTSAKTPANILYVGMSGDREIPRIKKLSNANSNNVSMADISVPGVPSNAYVSDIAVNPNNANEILVTFSNYNITSIYYSTNGGTTYTAVSANLDGSQQNPGPSVRATTILPYNGRTYYLAATSVGIFSAEALNGSNTVWEQEGFNVTGNVIISDIQSRTSDGKVAAGSHGRGIFTGSPGGTVNVNDEIAEISAYKLDQNYPNPFNPSTVISYQLAVNSNVELKIYDLLGKEIRTLVSEKQSAGSYNISFNASDLASGTYIYRLQANDFADSRKMVLIK